NLTEHFSVNAPLAFYHFNRVEGHALDLGLYLAGAFEQRLNSSLLVSYGFGDKKLKTDFSASYLFGKYRTYSLSLNLFNRTNILFGTSENYNELTATLLSLISKYEFRNYYYSKGFEAE